MDVCRVGKVPGKCPEMGSWTAASGQAAETGPWELVTESWEAEVTES